MRIVKTHYRAGRTRRQGVAIRGMGWAHQGRPAPPGVTLPADSPHLRYADLPGLLAVRALAAALADAGIDPAAGSLPIAFLSAGGLDDTVALFWEDLRAGGPVSPSLFAMTQPGAPAAVAARVWDWTAPVRVWVGGPGALQAAADCVFGWLTVGGAPAAVLAGLRRGKSPRRAGAHPLTAWAIVLGQNR